MKKLALFGCIILLCLTTFAHNELVGEILFETDGNKVFITATLEKRHLALALKKEQDCAPQDMIKECGNKYIQEHFKLILDQKDQAIKYTSHSLDKQNITYRFEFDLKGKKPEDIQQIIVNSDYMVKHNDHAILRIIFNLDANVRTFNISNHRNKIICNYN